MTLDELAKELIAANRENRVRELLETHYHADTVSVEGVAFEPDGNREAPGLAAIKAKHDWWDENFEVHSFEIEGPFVHGDDRFAVIYDVDVTHKASGNRIAMREVAVYHARDGKVVREEFFQATP